MPVTLEHKSSELKKELPAIILIGGGIAAAYFLLRSGSSAPGSKTNAYYPRAVGGQRGQQGRQRSSSVSNDSGSLATQVIGDIIGSHTQLVDAADQLKLGELQLQTEQNIAYRESNVQAQQSVNSEQPPPNGWNQFFGMLFNALPMAFGFPPMGSSFGFPQQQQSPYNSGYPWMNPGAIWQGGWGGYYPQQSYPSPYGSGVWG